MKTKHQTAISRRSATGLILSAAAGSLFAPRIARAAEPASLRLDWLLSGYHLPLYWAVEKGYFKDAGIDLDIRDGSGSSKSVNLVSAKEDTFAISDCFVTANAIGRGVKVKMIYVIVQNGGSAIVSWEENAIKKPQDMIGKSVGASADQKLQFELFLRTNNIPVDKVQLRVVSAEARNTVFYQKQVDSIISTVVGSPMDMIVAAKEGRGPPVHLMPFADFGITAMSQGALVSTETMATKPDLVKRFCEASIRGIKDLVDVERADEATDIAMRASKAPAQRRESVKLQWLATIPRLHTSSSHGKPLGWMAEEDWKKTVNLLVETKALPEPVATSLIYTNDFLPA